MADVATTDIRHAELLLGHCLDLWERMPEIEHEIDQWDLLDQLHFTEEWPLEEQRLKRLDHYAAAGTLTPDQVARFDRLKLLVAAYRPIVRRIRDG